MYTTIDATYVRIQCQRLNAYRVLLGRSGRVMSVPVITSTALYLVRFPMLCFYGLFKCWSRTLAVMNAVVLAEGNIH